MADTAFQTKYRQEYIHGFEQRQTLLRGGVTTEADVKGNTAVFLVADSGSAIAKTRGVDGLIPARADNNTQNSCTLAEWHDLARKTGFNIESSQGNQRLIMQNTTMGTINRKIDSDILTALLTGTIQTNSGVGVTATIDLVMQAKTKLGNASVPWDSNLFAVITPAFEAYLMRTKEFASREYVNKTLPSDGADLAWRDRPLMYNWMGVNWMVHPNISGIATTTERCFMWHRNSIGHAVNLDMNIKAGYDEEQDYSWARTSIYMGSKLLQNAGVVEMTHDGSAYA